MATINKNTITIYDGPSRIDGQRIIVLATGLKSASTNRKTGGMVQTHILRADIKPTEALRTGKDSSICGGCIHRPKSFDGTNYRSRSCYVNMQASTAMWKAWKRGSYATTWDARTFANRKVRLGTYGDPAAVPTAVWDRVLKLAKAWTGYTHQAASARLRDTLKYCQFSADSLPDAQAAHNEGLGTFRVLGPTDTIADFETVCPASSEAGKRTTCNVCLKCNGSKGFNIAINAHGIGASSFQQRIA
jgi:hypothetical protein